jgi:hypothetical protein
MLQVYPASYVLVSGLTQSNCSSLGRCSSSCTEMSDEWNFYFLGELSQYLSTHGHTLKRIYLLV